MVRRATTTQETRRVWRGDLSQIRGTLLGYVLGIPPYPAWITVEDEHGKRSSADAAHEDIVIASVEALVAAINQLLRAPQRESAQPVG